MAYIDYRDRILQIMNDRGINRNRLASILDISPVSLHTALVSRKNNLSMDTFERILDILNLEMNLTDRQDLPTNMTLGIPISKNNLNELLHQFLLINKHVLIDNEEQIEFELQEWIIENGGTETLIANLTKEEKFRIRELLHGQVKSIHNFNVNVAPLLKELHSKGFVLLPARRLLEIAARVNIRNHFGNDTNSLKKSRFPGSYTWDLTNYETVQVPF